ncbi:MAG: ABC transporter ATP-binding protein [Cyanobacteria bacterium CRU_2_1]|nr:ABC transporter ATP-binding protein [Cyanobacteria bacterium RU_5_0]NJR60554.1 ABC transporter ATP-binding protein [Cyanobacteria bacterium CRU_2_1]
MTATPISFQVSLPESTAKVFSQGCETTLDAFRTAGKAIVARGVEMIYQSGSQRFHALKHINLEVNKGDIHLLMGPSGSGKTTLLSILGGILTPTDGGICLLGQDITRMSQSQLSKFRLKNIGFIFQEFNLFPALTALENVALALDVKGIKGRAAKREAMGLLEQVGLANKAKSLPRDLSGGQKQRVAIARALSGNPQIIMADEPTAALDSQSGHAVITLLRQLAKEENRTVVMVTHDPRIIDVADRVTYLEDGILQNNPTAIHHQKLA